MLVILLVISLSLILLLSSFIYGHYVGYKMKMRQLDDYLEITIPRVNRMFKRLHLKECKFCQYRDKCRDDDHSKCNKFYKHFNISDRHYQEICECFKKKEGVNSDRR